MTHDQDQITEEHPRDLEIAEKILKPRRDRAERAYDRALTTLWVGNAGAALATLAYITANRHDGTFTRSLLVPLVLFVLGLAVYGHQLPDRVRIRTARDFAYAKSESYPGCPVG
jgi:hypothetical protein